LSVLFRDEGRTVTDRGALAAPDVLWDAAVQARDPAEVRRRAEQALRHEWDRVWQEPVPFYQRRFAAAGLSARELPPLDEIPTTTKPDLRADEAVNPPFGTHRVIGLERAVRLGSSTGTTGTPTLIFYGPTDLDVAGEIGVRNMWRHGVRAGDRFTHSWPQGIYPTNVTGGRSYLTIGAVEIAVGPPFTPQIAAEHLALWELLRPTAFMMTGAQLRTYEEAAATAEVNLPGLMAGAIFVFLEASCQFEQPRRRVEQAYGVTLRNTGGASEIPGFATTDCSAHTGLHVAGDHFVVQACDPRTGRQVAAGERGTLVVSAFEIDALFLRYDVQDIVTIDEGPCPCGETGPRYTLLGRAADAVEIGGRTLLPLDVQLALDDHGAPEFQLLGANGDAVALKVEDDDHRADRFETAIRDSLDVKADVETVAVGSLPRSTFKPRRTAQSQ
jgi:phenylacetate-CoA ligase